MILQYTSVAGNLVMADLAHVTRDQERFLMGDARPEYRPAVARSLAAMAVYERRLMACVSPAQRAIGWGAWVWFRFEPSRGMPSVPDVPVTIYGYIYTASELARREHEAWERIAAAGQVPQRPEETIAACHESHAAGWRYGLWHSEIEPAGEPGENHIAMLTPMTRVQFEAARAAGWPEVPPGV